MKQFRKTLIAGVTFLSGLYFFLEFVLPQKIGSFEFGFYHDQISRGVQTVGVMAIGLGIINIVRVHGLAILRARKGWGNSFALILGLLITFVIEGAAFVNSERSVAAWQEFSHLGKYSQKIKEQHADNPVGSANRASLIAKRLNDIEAKASSGEGFLSTLGEETERKEVTEAFKAALEESKSAAQALAEVYGEKNSDGEILVAAHSALESSLGKTATAGKDLAQYNLEQTSIKSLSHAILEAILAPLGAAMFSLLAFYMASAAYRSFRIRSLEASIMLLAAVVVMLGQIPQGPIYIHDGLPRVRLWLLENLSTPAFRAIFFGSAVAGLAMAVRMWFSLERSPLASQEVE